MAILLVGCGKPTPVRTGGSPLAEFVGMDLRHLRKGRTADVLDGFLKSKGIGVDGTSRPRPWAVWDWKGDGSLFVLACAWETRIGEQDCLGEVYAFDAGGKLLSSSEFMVGMNSAWQAVNLAGDARLGKVVHFLVQPAGEKVSLAGVYVGFDEARPALVRVEDAAGKLTANEYGSPGAQLGPEPNVAALSSELRSDSPVRQLEALVWLGGKHYELPGLDLGFEPYHESYAHAARWREMAGDAEVVARVAKLAKSDIPWVRAEAEWVEKNDQWGVPLVSHPKPGGVKELTLTDVKVGDGGLFDRPGAVRDGDLVNMKYRVSAVGGKVFEAKDGAHDTPLAVIVGHGSVVPGWDLGLRGMKVGGIRKMLIPSRLGYGAVALKGLPADSDLEVTVTLLDLGRADERVETVRDIEAGDGQPAVKGNYAFVRYRIGRVGGDPIGVPDSPAWIKLGGARPLDAYVLGMRLGGVRKVRIPKSVNDVGVTPDDSLGPFILSVELLKLSSTRPPSDDHSRAKYW